MAHIKLFLITCCISFFSISLLADEVLKKDEDIIDFENPDTFIDISEAINSKQYVHRTILSTAIKYTSGFSFERFCFNHLMGYSAVWQRVRPHIKYITGVQGISVGYISSKGHSAEIGLEFSAVTNITLGYKHVFKTDAFYSMWPYIGIGPGVEISQLKLANGPLEADRYDGTTIMGFIYLGLLIPLVDVGLKAEVRFNFYGLDRIVFTQGVGATIFL